MLANLEKEAKLVRELVLLFQYETDKNSIKFFNRVLEDLVGEEEVMDNPVLKVKFLLYFEFISQRCFQVILECLAQVVQLESR